MISITYAQELFAVSARSESTRPSERTSTKSRVPYWESTLLQTTRNPQQRSPKRACLYTWCKSAGVDPPGALRRRRRKRTARTRTSPPIIPRPTSPSWMRTPPPRTIQMSLARLAALCRALGSLVLTRFERAPLWLTEVSPSARVLLVAFPRLLAIAWRHGANLASLSKNSGRICADGLKVIGEVFFLLYPVRRFFQGKM